jgi:hypothetical protein
MADLFWLASYPKSGNTWIRILLANYRTDAPACINALSQYGMSGAFLRSLFDRYCGLKSSTLPAHTAERLQPDVYRMLAAHAPMPLVLKVHDGWKQTDRGEALFPSDVTTGTIYVLRNVLDVAPSAADHWGVDCATAVERLCDPHFALASDPQVLSPGLRQHLGSWSGHVASWVDRSGLAPLVVRYEDLVADTAGALAKIVACLGWNVEAQRIDRAVNNSHFAKLQARERETGFREASPVSRSSFFRSGRAGTWREALTPELTTKLVERHGDMMQRFGYIDGRGYPLESVP